ncbi:hypothetical protein BDV96DRAFT_570422 [Lophiotrema nucula]|uniref:Zn(2)-C6 fungal-type domain-containing protein n=1 Tax=Lophiotrema nucula TaxID=690887 RepID=A0A6A5ZGP5_9PLEO|nr:hypothetical protein BDV96DRAFT_570422 [Lophiotrema nucula]
MAEIGLIASVIQVAGAGLKLSQSIYQYADSVASADRRLKDIAKEVRLTSFVIDELARVFKQDETASLLSDNARRTADETVKECSSMFVELDADIKKSRKSKLGRLTLPFREPKIELIRSHIDKLKSTLQLLLGVLTHAYQVASHKRNGEAEAAQREQIKALMQSKKQNEMKYQESLRNFGLSKESTNVGDDDASNEEDTMMSITSIASTITVQSLEACVQHVQGLLTDIEALQKGLSTRALEGPDPSEHQQSLIGSYFRARNFLDTVLLGSTKGFAAADKREKTGSTTARTELSISQEVALSGQPEKRDQQKWPNSDNVRLPPSSHISTDSSALEDAGLQRSSLVRPMMPMRPKRKERDMRAETGKTELVISDAHVPKEQLSFERSCSTCWSRRVRCDETKPACLQCTRTRRRCPGYWILQSASHEEDQGGVGYRRRPSAPAYPPSSPTESDLSSPEPERVKNMFARSSAFEDDGLSSVEAIRPTGYQTGRRDPDLAHLTTEELKDRLLKAETRLAREREAKRERYVPQMFTLLEGSISAALKKLC